MTKYGEELRTARTAAGKTQGEVAAAVGQTGGYLSDIEYGRRAPLDTDRTAVVAQTIGIPAIRLQALAAVERGEIVVKGLGVPALERVLRLVSRLREKGAAGGGG